MSRRLGGEPFLRPKPVNLRALAPAETLVYLETNDLGKTLSAITENKNFAQLAKNKPDLWALKGIQLAVAVTGFETVQKSESGETSEAGSGAVLDLKPRFVAVAETHAWNYQALSFTENKLGEFINQAFGGGVVLDAVDKNGGRWFTWSAEDGPKAFAFVQGSQVFFGNDEPAIEKCLAVKRGEAESLSAGARLPEAAENTLASGYISPDGVAQVSNIAAIGLAKRAGRRRGSSEVHRGPASAAASQYRARSELDGFEDRAGDRGPDHHRR